MFDDMTVQRFWSKVEVRSKEECWPWKLSIKSNTDYGKFTVKGKWLVPHRTALCIHTGLPYKNKFLSLHSCDNPPCCNPHHLRWGTHKDNSQDMVRRNRAVKSFLGKDRIGQNNPNRKLTKEQVDSIRSDNRTITEIAREYGVGWATVQSVRLHQSWVENHDRQTNTG